MARSCSSSAAFDWELANRPSFTPARPPATPPAPVRTFYWGRGWYVWNNTGDKVILRRADGSLKDTCCYGGAGSVKSPKGIQTALPEHPATSIKHPSNANHVHKQDLLLVTTLVSSP